MTKNQKIAAGIFSLLPLLSVIAYFIIFFNLFTSSIIPAIEEKLDGPPPGFIRHMILFVIWAIVMSMISIGLMIYFLIHSINNPYVSKDERIMWILLLIFLLVIAAPIYWYMRIWDTPHKEKAGTA